MKTLTYDKFEQCLASTSKRFMGAFTRGAGRAVAAFYGDELIVYPVTWELTGHANPTPDIRLAAYGDAEMFRSSFLAAVDACLKISEACSYVAELEQRQLDDAAWQQESTH